MGKDTIANKRRQQYSGRNTGRQKWKKEITNLIRPKKLKPKPEKTPSKCKLMKTRNRMVTRSLTGRNK